MFLERTIETFVLGLKNLARNKLRSFLTMLGMIFGVGSVIAMLSVGAGARHEILSRIQELGITNIIVNSVRPPEQTRSSDVADSENYIDRYGLTFRDRDHILMTCPTVRGVMPVNLVKKRVWYGSNRVQASVLGVQPEHLAMFGLDVSRGRTFNHIDAATEAKVCIVRRGLVEQLNAVADPVGMALKIGGFPFGR
jgi:putative ABC transport system permease protein